MFNSTRNNRLYPVSATYARVAISKPLRIFWSFIDVQWLFSVPWTVYFGHYRELLIHLPVCCLNISIFWRSTRLGAMFQRPRSNIAKVTASQRLYHPCRSLERRLASISNCPVCQNFLRSLPPYSFHCNKVCLSFALATGPALTSCQGIVQSLVTSCSTCFSSAPGIKKYTPLQ